MTGDVLSPGDILDVCLWLRRVEAGIHRRYL